MKIQNFEWHEICQKHNKWCYFSQVENMTLSEAEKFISKLKTSEPVD